MLHVPALPGSPRNRLPLDGIVAWVLQDAEAFAAGGIDTVVLENFGDVPFYPGRVPPHTVAFMTRLACEVRRRAPLRLGINLLRNDAESALAVASAVGAEFIRVNIHSGARVTDQGVISGLAHETLRYRKLLGSDVLIFADVDVKHSAPLASRLLGEEVEEAVSRGCADAIIVSGSGTGKRTALDDLEAAKRAAGGVPVFAGSGVDAATGGETLQVADGVIAGTALKQGGNPTAPVDPQRVREFVAAAKL
jgi:membrane complex biogenesis BtpA family protein